MGEFGFSLFFVKIDLETKKQCQLVVNLKKLTFTGTFTKVY